MQLLTKLLIIGAIVGGYMFAVSPYIIAGGSGTVVMLGWCFGVAPVVNLTWRIELRRVTP